MIFILKITINPMKLNKKNAKNNHLLFRLIKMSLKLFIKLMFQSNNNNNDNNNVCFDVDNY